MAYKNNTGRNIARGVMDARKRKREQKQKNLACGGAIIVFVLAAIGVGIYFLVTKVF